MENNLKRFDETAEKWLASLNTDSKLKDAFCYALQGKGKRLRPLIAWMVADALQQKEDVSFAALAIELFHTASLIADDLPCMDDDDERRNRPALHKMFGEPLALLTSYALIAAGYECLAACAEQAKKNDQERLLLAIKNVSENTGILGACHGQLLDLAPPDSSLETLRQVIHQKTGVLFEIAFVLGWTFGGGEMSLLPKVKQAAYHFGQYFQMKDDLGDQEKDRAQGKQVNIALALGDQEARALIQKEKESYQVLLKELGIASPELVSLSAE